MSTASKNLLSPSTNITVPKFYSLLHSKIRSSSRNKSITSYLNSTRSPDRIRNVRTTPQRQSNLHEEQEKLDKSDLFMWFIVKKRKMRDLIPDIEFLKYREICSEMISTLGSCSEAHFGLGKLYSHEASFDIALQHIRIALSEEKSDRTYNLWNATLNIFRVNSKKRALQAKKISCCKTNTGLLKKQEVEIEILWGLMELSQSDYLKIGIEIESAHHYAARIYQLDTYYGALAWSEIFLAGLDLSKGETILKELISNYSSQPEAYIKLWSYYYNATKDYTSALQIAESAFISVSQSNYSVVLSLNYARSLFKSGKTRSCLELLQLEYTKHSLFTVILYHYGRFCIKSKDPHFVGSAIGALEECLNTTSESRHGQIYYWLAKAYILAEEKLDAFTCAKKGIPILSTLIDKSESFDREYERNLCHKLNELKDIMKDLHIHIISISMLERLLDEPNIKIDECKLYCSAVKEFDVLEGFIYEAKLWWKIGNPQKAKEILYSKLHLTRVKMKAYIVLAEFFESEGNFEEMLHVSKEMVKKCRSPIVPVQIWIDANMIYSKSLIKQRKFDEALLVYKGLAQVQPIPFIPDVRYTRELQRAYSKEDLITVLSRMNDKDYRYSYLSSNLVDYQIQRSKLVCSKQYFVSTLLGDDEEEHEKLSECTKAGSTDPSDSELIGSRAPEPLPKSRISSIPCGDSANIGFSVTTSYFFLYKIGKTCAKFCIHIEEGMHALHDFLNMHHYWTRDGIEVHEELKVKAKFWLGMLYYQNNQLGMAEEVFQDISSMLFQLGRTKMSAEVLKILQSCKV